MDEREKLLTLLVTAHECISGRTPYTGRPVGNSPEFMILDNSLNRYILHSFHFHCILSNFVLDGDGTEEEERNMRFSFSTTKEITIVLKRI